MQIKKEDKDQKPQMPQSITALTTTNRCSILIRHRQWVHCTLRLLENVNALVYAVSLREHRYFISLMRHFSLLEKGPKVWPKCSITTLAILVMERGMSFSIWTTVRRQNKNNAVIEYGIWRVLTGLHDY
ncbi:hypothetical protein DPMN_004817 [Dreissena polymorpha]|uniref:Uncharacterized protein n=1 Tax=Dreissena polymorpha TaxID=45954 RepID=A0A9D4MP68_DREPO|nr:hypothetical protein DPMN_004817 [Dreissena polymorpha]